MRSFTIARAAVLPLFGLVLAACSVGGDEDLALGRGNASGAEKGRNPQVPSKGREPQVPSKGGEKDESLADDVEFVPVEGDAGHLTGGALSEGKEVEGKEVEGKEIEGKGIEGKGIEQPVPSDIGKGEGTKEPTPIEVGKEAGEKESEIPSKGGLPSKGPLGSKGGLPSNPVREVNSACPKAQGVEVVGACVQALTYAKNPETGECCVYATPCDVPKTWEASFVAEAVCR
ncbi:hypothetical protein [Polyangium mundeleinium]|uniref:Secreted protein n=1 Tax=Polyangium mundeleinium TaxID=2995306 RepID=A0ABT5EJ92_9BACT|nr:hypothetical protein [Polyangium mundeleinium]MDC0741442.1 hypothetical protein [Polyangium mundeleinium]